MPVKFFCNDCGKEIWSEMTQDDKNSTTISEAERTCFCSDCLLKKYKESKMTQDERTCPKCDYILSYEEVDIGVGTQRGNYHCDNCGWNEEDLIKGWEIRNESGEIIV